MFQTRVSYIDVPALFSVSCPTEGAGVWHKSTKITEWVCSKQLKVILSVIQLQNFTQDLLITSNWETVVGQRFPCFRTGLGWSLSKQRVCVTLTEVNAFSSKVVVVFFKSIMVLVSFIVWNWQNLVHKLQFFCSVQSYYASSKPATWKGLNSLFDLLLRADVWMFTWTWKAVSLSVVCLSEI